MCIQGNGWFRNLKFLGIDHSNLKVKSSVFMEQNGWQSSLKKKVTEFSTVLNLDNASARKIRSIDKPEIPWRWFKIWNPYLQHGYAPGSHMTANEELVSYNAGAHFVYIHLQIRILQNKSLSLLCLNSY